MGFILERFIFCPPDSHYSTFESDIILVPGEGYQIPCLHIQQPGAELTILYAHGTSNDLGLIRGWLNYLATTLTVNIISFDYAGYGQHPLQKCSVESTYRDIRSVYDYIRINLRIPPNCIVIWGTSLGTGPVSYLAKYLCRTEPIQPLAGVILQSPFTSIGSAVLTYLISSKWVPVSWLYGSWGCSLYPNIERISDIMVPVFIFHGVKDELIPYSHSMVLSIYVPYLWRCWLSPEAGHGDFNVKKREEIISNLRLYFDYLPLFNYPVRQRARIGNDDGENEK